MADTTKLTHLSGIKSTDPTLGFYFTAGTADPVTEGQITYVTGTGFRAYGASGVFTVGSGGGGGVVGSLDNAYSIGQDITVDEGAITLIDATAGTLNTFEIIKSGAGSGNLIDVAVNTTFTGNVIDIDLNAGVGSKGLYIDGGGGARTADMVDLKFDGTGNADAVYIASTCTGSGAVFDIDMNGTLTGQVFNVDMNAAVGAKFLYLDAGAATRTVDLIDIKWDGDGNVDVMNITATNTGTGAIFDINMDGAGSTAGVFNVDMNAAVGAEFLYLDVGAGNRTANLIEIKYDGSGAVDCFAIVATDTSSGHIFDIDMGATHTGDVINIDMDAAVASRSIYIDAGGGTRTLDEIVVKHDGDGNVDVLSVVSTNTGTGSIFDINMDGNGSTGGVFNIDMNAAVGATVMTLDAGAGTRTVDMIDVTFDGDGNVGFLDINVTNTGSGNIIDVDIDSIHTGNIISITYGTAASTGDAVELAMGTNVAGSAIVISAAGARTDDLIKIDDSSTGAGARAHFDIDCSGTGTYSVLDIAQGNTAVNVSPIVITRGIGTNAAAAILVTDNGTSSAGVIDINVAGIATTAAVFDITYSAAATNDAIQVVMADAVAASAFVVTATGIRTDDLFKIDSDHTGAGLIWDINLTGAASGNVFDLTYSVGANTGNAISLAMGTNVAGQAIVVTSAATGVSGEGSALQVAHTGNLAAGANLIQIISTGNHDATSDVVYLEQSTGAGTAGTTLLRLNATGANVEALAIDAGVAFLSAETATPGSGNGETLPVTSNVVFYDPNGGSRTGVIITTGLREGQLLWVVNIADAAESITFAAAGTSNVAGGASVSVARYETVTFVWNAATSLWYCMGAGL
jgi:hypothetical protein